jgi:cytochrome b561
LSTKGIQKGFDASFAAIETEVSKPYYISFYILLIAVVNSGMVFMKGHSISLFMVISNSNDS